MLTMLSVFWLFISLLCEIFVVSGELTVKPNNLIAVVGRQAVLRCSAQSDQSLTWHHRQIGNSLFSNAISVEAIDDSSQRQLDVVVGSVRQEDAGQYQCRGSSADKVDSTNLVVLGVVPNCTTEVLGDLDLTADGHLLMWCTFNWTDNFNPSMPWFDPAGYEFLQTHLSAAISQTALEQRFLVAHIKPTDNNDDRTKLFDLSLAADQTEPGYVFNWSNVNLTVSMSVRNLRIRVIRPDSFRPINCCSSSEVNVPVLHVGDQLVCEADGPSDVQYRWEEVLVHGAVPLHYSQSSVFSLSRPGQHVFRCTASHHIRDDPYNESAQITVRVLPHDYHTTPVVTGSSDDGLSDSLFYGPPLAGFVVFVVVIAVAFVVYRRRTKRPCRQDSTNIDDQTDQSDALRVDAAAVPACPERSAPDAYRRSLPLPTVNESDVHEQAYEDVDNENQPVVVDLPTIDESPDSDLATPGEERLPSQVDPDTTPKSFYEPLSLELRSFEEQTPSKPPNKYIRIIDVDPLSKDTSAVDLCCTDAVLFTCSADSCSRQISDNAIRE